MLFNNKYQEKEIIGKGGFGIVYKVFYDELHIYYALKFIQNTKNNESKNLQNEYGKKIETFKNISNKNIVQIKDNFYDELNKGYCIVMELCDGDLKDILNKYKPKGLPLNLIKKIFIQLNEALKIMKSKGCNNKDLKPENILIKYTDNNKTNFDIKLNDFGLSNKESTINNFINVKTKDYTAPEIDKKNYNDKSVLWSLGVILYELYTNKYIFESNNPKDREINRVNGIIIKETDNEMINNLIKKLIKTDVNERISWKEYFEDEFFKVNKVERVNIVKNDKNINNSGKEQIIKIKINVMKDNEKIKIFNGNEDINEKNIKIFLEENEIKKEIDNLKKGIYKIIIKINQNITNCKKIFSDCKNITEINFYNFDTKNVTDMSEMFSNCWILNDLNINNFDTKNVKNMSLMFYKCKNLKNINVTNFDTKNVTNMSGMFYGCLSLNNLNISNFNTRNVVDLSWMFNRCSSLINLEVNHFDTKNVVNLNRMFCFCSSLTVLDVTNFVTANVTDMSGMFCGCKLLTNLNVSNFNTKNVTNMSGMFYYCRSLINLDVNNFDTQNVTNMSDMFYNCKSLNNLEISNFDTKNVINMSAMFYNCKRIKTLEVNNFDTKNVINMSSMFYNCTSLNNLNVNNFDTSNVTNMCGMFYNCTSLNYLDVSNFDTSNVTNMSAMFYNCKSLNNLDINNFDTSNVTNRNEMLFGVDIMRKKNFASKCQIF